MEVVCYVQRHRHFSSFLCLLFLEKKPIGGNYHQSSHNPISIKQYHKSTAQTQRHISSLYKQGALLSPTPFNSQANHLLLLSSSLSTNSQENTAPLLLFPVLISLWFSPKLLLSPMSLSIRPLLPVMSELLSPGDFNVTVFFFLVYWWSVPCYRPQSMLHYV